MGYEVRIPCRETRRVEFENIYYFDTKEDAEEFLEEIKKSEEALLLPDETEDVEIIDSRDVECLAEEAYIEKTSEKIVKYITVENNVVKSIEKIPLDIAMKRLKEEYESLEDPIGGLEETLENLIVTGYDHYGIPVTYQIIK